MGFYTHSMDGNMFLPESNFPALQKALPDLLKKYDIEESIEYILTAYNIRYQSQLESKDDWRKRWAKEWFEIPESVRALLAALREIGSENNFEINYGKSEEVNGFSISFDEKKNLDDSFLFSLAPFLRPGCYMQLRDDNYTIWRYVAKDGKLEYVEPKWA